VVFTVWSGGGASVGVVAEGVDMHAALGVGVVAGDVPRHRGGARLRGLLERHGAFDIGVSTNDGN
jgi:hypothetical protein